jgi:hypothetical protein
MIIKWYILVSSILWLLNIGLHTFGVDLGKLRETPCIMIKWWSTEFALLLLSLLSYCPKDRRWLAKLSYYVEVYYLLQECSENFGYCQLSITWTAYCGLVRVYQFWWSVPPEDTPIAPLNPVVELSWKLIIITISKNGTVHPGRIYLSLRIFLPSNDNNSSESTIFSTNLFRHIYVRHHR